MFAPFFFWFSGWLISLMQMAVDPLSYKRRSNAFFLTWWWVAWCGLLSCEYEIRVPLAFQCTEYFEVFHWQQPLRLLLDKFLGNNSATTSNVYIASPRPSRWCSSWAQLIGQSNRRSNGQLLHIAVRGIFSKRRRLHLTFSLSSHWYSWANSLARIWLRWHRRALTLHPALPESLTVLGQPSSGLKNVIWVCPVLLSMQSSSN